MCKPEPDVNVLFRRSINESDVVDQLKFSCLYVFSPDSRTTASRRVYVGFTKNLRRRLSEHRREGINKKVGAIRDGSGPDFDDWECGVVFRYLDDEVHPAISQHVVEHVVIALFETCEAGLNSNLFDL